MRQYEVSQEMTAKEARESILEIQVNVSLVGHDLGPIVRS
jgi:hypothetical protein